MNRIIISTCVLVLVIISGLHAQNKPGGSRATATAVAVPAAYTTTSTNYLRSWEPDMPSTDTAQVVATGRTVREVKQSTQYFDGLGRPIQSVSKGISSRGNDLVSPVIYDIYGREQYKYLPYVQGSDNTSDGNLKMNPYNAQQSFYQNAGLNPGVVGESIYYNRTEFEASPLNRPLKSYEAGNSWTTHPVQTGYGINVATDSVIMWTVGTGVPVSGGTYEAGQLQKTTVLDEHGNQSIEFKDKQNKIVLKKVQVAQTPGTGHVGWLCTYYVYDDLYNLRCVIPPLAVEAIKSTWVISTAIANELCIQYQYDSQQRLIIKKVPGAGPVFMVYDVRDRLVFEQDSIQRAKSPMEWKVNVYDEYNRPTMTAIYKATSTREALQENMNSAPATQSLSYTVPASADLTLYKHDGSTKYIATNSITVVEGFQTGDDDKLEMVIDAAAGDAISTVATNTLPNISAAALDPLTYTFYDNYDYSGSLPYDNQDISKLVAADSLYPDKLEVTTMTKGLVTGTKVRVFGMNKWLTTSTYYNDKGRVIQQVADNNLGGRDVLTTLYSFKGVVLANYLRHQNPKSSTLQGTVLTTMNYDHGGRLLSVKKRLNDDANQEKTVATSSYDELGHLKQKQLGVAATGRVLDSLNYTYNIRGWMQGINKDYVNSGDGTANWFGEELNYDYGFESAQYNGNIAGVKWKTRSSNARAFGYTYDMANRLTRADFNQQNTAGAAWTADKVDFTVSKIRYDANGNIGNFKQQGLFGNTSGTVDDLTYTYQSGSNKLQTVTDVSKTIGNNLGDFNDGTNTGNDYAYDGNGNLVIDQNRGISGISYNLLNLPENVFIKGKGKITYQYNAAGVKLKKTIVDSTASPVKTIVYDYDGIFLYRQDSLQYISHEDGRIRPLYETGKAIRYTYDYFEKDHLGNIRVILGAQTDTSVYAATLETAASATENALFGNIDNTRSSLPSGYPADATTNPNAYVARLNAVNGQKIGPTLVLRVMAGDTIRLGVKAFYKSTAANTSNATSSSMLTSLLQAFSGAAVADGSHAASGSNSAVASSFTSSIYETLKQKDPTQNLSDKPKAYLNYALFDDQFNLVNNNSGVKQVQGNPNELQTLAVDRFAVTKTGFIYIYLSNESEEDVYFDNLVVVHNGGPLLEETHYYPFGLTMAGISAGALKGVNYYANQKKYNGNELQTKEFGDGSGLEWFDFNARTYDQQVGRFMQIDPLFESGEQETMSPYHFAKNNPVKYNDPDGKCPNCLAGAVVGFVVDAVIQVSVSVAKQVASGKPVTFEQTYKDYSWYQGVAAAGAGAITSGLSAVEEAGTSLVLKTLGVQASISVWRQTNQHADGSVNLPELVIDAIPVPEGAKRSIVSTRAAEKAVVQAENRIAASTSKVPARKINQLATAKATLNRQVETNNVYNMTGEMLKAASGKTATLETHNAANTPQAGGALPGLGPVPPPQPSDNTRVNLPPIYR